MSTTKLVLLVSMLALLTNAGTFLVTAQFSKLQAQLAVSETVVKAQQAISQLQNYVPTPVDKKTGTYSILVPPKAEKDKARRFTVKVVSEQ